MKRTTIPGQNQEENYTEPGSYPASRFGEIGAPGFMLAPEGCPEKKHRFPPIGECVDLAICGYYCRNQCEKYHRFRKNAQVKEVG